MSNQKSLPLGRNVGAALGQTSPTNITSIKWSLCVGVFPKPTHIYDPITTQKNTIHTKLQAYEPRHKYTHTNRSGNG